MLFLFSAAARFNKKAVTEVAVRSQPRLNQKAKALAQELSTLDAKAVRRQLHVNDALAKQYSESLQKFEKNRPVACCGLYDSPLFETIGFPTFDSEDGEWANNYVRIFSGLYGILRPYDEIQPLSLPVALHTKLKNSKGAHLKDFWRDAIAKELEDALKRCPMPVIINMANTMDTDGLLSQDMLPDGTQVMTVDFKLAQKDKSAQAAGEFVRWALESRVMTMDEIFEYKGYGVEEGDDAEFRLASDNRDGSKIVFEENVGGGGDDDWKQKLADSGLSLGKFRKEFASGKQRYKRTEMNKALAKDKKQSRKKHAVY